jgi:hypothetical protein
VNPPFPDNIAQSSSNDSDVPYVHAVYVCATRIRVPILVRIASLPIEGANDDRLTRIANAMRDRCTFEHRSLGIGRAWLGEPEHHTDVRRLRCQCARWRGVRTHHPASDRVVAFTCCVAPPDDARPTARGARHSAVLLSSRVISTTSQRRREPGSPSFGAHRRSGRRTAHVWGDNTSAALETARRRRRTASAASQCRIGQALGSVQRIAFWAVAERIQDVVYSGVRIHNS